MSGETQNRMNNENTDKPLRVLHVIGGLGMGGAESRAMDMVRNSDPSILHYDFLLCEPVGIYEKEAESLGCRIYRVPRFLFYNYFSYVKALKKVFSEHPEIDVVLGSMTSTASIYMPVAKKCGVPLTVAYARSAGVDPGIKGTLTKMLRKNLYKKCDVCAAVSEEAGRAVYGNKRADEGKVWILHTANNLKKFVHNDENIRLREEIREKYGLQDKFVIGHVGRFHYAKNHLFLLDVYKEYLKKDENARLLLVGNGGTKESVEKKAAELGISDKVVFAGETSEPSGFYQAFDMVVFPSFYEGLPGMIVEAVSAGLPCLISDSITKEVDVPEYVEYCSLNENAEVWADKAAGLYGRVAAGRPAGNRLNDLRGYESLKKMGFDAGEQARVLPDVFREYINKLSK